MVTGTFVVLILALIGTAIIAAAGWRSSAKWRAYALSDDDAVGFVAWAREYPMRWEYQWEGQPQFTIEVMGVRAIDREPLLAFRKAKAMIEARDAVSEALLTAEASVKF